MAAAKDRVTKRFYARFKAERERFLGAVEGIADGEQRTWYASLLLSRLMFTYFLQRQGFLAGDEHYLRNRMAMIWTQACDGVDPPDRFYRGFLLPFFHHGLGQPAEARAPELTALLGDIPYVSGGLFEDFPIEASNPAITIPDAAFERIFDFFDGYEWHLDERPPHGDREITPDVLGYIFEKYINQKQMGAYYTKEDVTSYIGRNTIIPYLLDTARADCKVAFDAHEGEVWRLLRDDPDAYIYEAVRHGVDEPLAPEIAAGLDDVSQRGGWNRPAPEPFALPTETWREHVARRTRCLDLRAKLAAGEITQVNDLITDNLDIERFALDAIERCEGPELLRAFWKALTGVTILDPTCGSGAFLFAALNILEPLYEACLNRMQALAAVFDRAGDSHEGEDFRRVLTRVAEHPNQRHYVLKSIIAANLYGVDLMAEACEVARMRLFLKLVAQVGDARQLELQPDLAINIRAGNALAGCVAPRATEQRSEGNGLQATKPPQGSDRHVPFDWCVEFPAIMAAGGFDAIIGNPPYIEYSAVRESDVIARYDTASCGDLYAFVCERALQLLSRSGRLGVIVPLSSIATQRMHPLQDLLFGRHRQAWVSAFDVYPSKLFDGAKQRLTIVLLDAADSGGSILSTRYARWKPAERTALFPTLAYHSSYRDALLGVVPKLGDRMAADLLRKVAAFRPAPFVACMPSPSLYVHRIPYNYVKAVDFVPYFWNAVNGRKKSADYKPYYLPNPEHVGIVLAVLNSNLFFWWWYTLFEGYHCGRHEIHSFPIGLDRMDEAVGARLAELGQALMADLKRNAARREATYTATGTVRYDELYPRRSKALLDQIDATLASHYGLTDAELDAVVNFDVKYRTTGDMTGYPG